MDPIRFGQRKSTSTERFLGAFSYGQSENPNFTSSVNDSDELSEDDVVFLSGQYNEPNHPSTPSSPSASSTLRHQHRHQNHHSYKGFGPPDTFGILAALAEDETSPSVRSVSHFYHKASVSSSSSSSSSSSRLIPVIPKPPPERISLHTNSSTLKYHQSAPVNVPVLSQAMMNTRRRQREFDEVAVDEDEGDGEMLPPHEIVARSSVQSPILACSVLEGVGRTLKGSDLRKVRNAVWRQTGFLD
ncbi:Senescence regulator [Quillaja saponaria]|uniref:Senescence regulator n=1 Tax=Quillaja saponaria TaxID=32244 RepID=A0AAD7PA84_QUISA|nr:Senescence regulator [Quillaja saponaria]